MKRGEKMERHTVYTDNSALYDVQQEIKGFLKNHNKKLNDDERNELGELLNRRAKALSDALGVEVGSIASSGKPKV